MYTVEEFDKAKTRILKYILYQPRCEGEVRRKFSKDMEEDLLEDVIEYLKEAKYLDDKEYIKRIVNNFKILKSMSIKELKYKLLTKGLNKRDIEEYISENNEDLEEYEIKSAKNIFNRKSNSKDQEEINQYLLRKGYIFDSINKALEE